MSCGKMTEQTVPCGAYLADAKIVPIKCGNTGYYGQQVFCAKCEKKGVKQAPYYPEEYPLDCEDFE
jgi:hypothetical protein